MQQEFDIDVEWRPFELHPEIPPLAGDEGLPFRPPTHVPNSRRSLEVAELAREQGAFDVYHCALFDAYFGRGQDIGDIAVLAELAACAGLDPGCAARSAGLRSLRPAGGRAHERGCPLEDHRHAHLYFRGRRAPLPHHRRAGVRRVRKRGAADGREA